VVLANSAAEWDVALAGDYFAVLASYPATSGRIDDLRADVEKVHARQAAFIVAADLLALTLLMPPGEWGADIVVGTTQRFGMPMGAGGPHAAFLACRDEFKRSMPGRLVGVSVDSHGNPAYRLALQTREQHIRREKATSNICTAQVLPAVVASMYAVYHGPEGLKRIAQRVASYTAILARGLEILGFEPRNGNAFDTLSLKTDGATNSIAARAVSKGANLRIYYTDYLCITLDETTTRDDVALIWSCFAEEKGIDTLPSFDAFEKGIAPLIPAHLRRSSAFLTHPVFNTHHSETEMLRYIRSLSDKDLALDRSMIPLGSCTMKLNATSEMIPITWPEFARPPLRPGRPAGRLRRARRAVARLAVPGHRLRRHQPAAQCRVPGRICRSAGHRAWHASKGDAAQHLPDPGVAHGTNPASAQMVGMQVVVTKCDTRTATSTSPTCRPSASSTASGWRRS
jgi:glycine dehydrogenase